MRVVIQVLKWFLRISELFVIYRQTLIVSDGSKNELNFVKPLSSHIFHTLGSGRPPFPVDQRDSVIYSLIRFMLSNLM